MPTPGRQMQLRLPSAFALDEGVEARGVIGAGMQEEQFTSPALPAMAIISESSLALYERIRTRLHFIW